MSQILCRYAQALRDLLLLPHEENRHEQWRANDRQTIDMYCTCTHNHIGSGLNMYDHKKRASRADIVHVITIHHHLSIFCWQANGWAWGIVRVQAVLFRWLVSCIYFAYLPCFSADKLLFRSSVSRAQLVWFGLEKDITLHAVAIQSHGTCITCHQDRRPTP